jgi:hypothetical protein
VAVCCEYGDKSSDAGATELVGSLERNEFVTCKLEYATEFLLGYVYILDCVVGNVKVSIGLTLQLHQY